MIRYSHQDNHVQVVPYNVPGVRDIEYLCFHQPWTRYLQILHFLLHFNHMPLIFKKLYHKRLSLLPFLKKKNHRFLRYHTKYFSSLPGRIFLSFYKAFFYKSRSKFKIDLGHFMNSLYLTYVWKVIKFYPDNLNRNFQQ